MNTEQDVLDIVRRMLSELQPPDAQPIDVKLDSRLDQDVGLDSLGRVELLNRLEQAFGVRLSLTDFQNAWTVHDLFNALGRAKPSLGGSAQGQELRQPAARGPDRFELPPSELPTLLDALQWHLREHPHREQITLIEDEAEHRISYATLWENARAVAGALQALGLAPGQTVVLMLPTGFEYFYAFLGVLMAGAAPVPIYPPIRWTQLEEHLERHALILENAQASMLIAVPELVAAARLLRARVGVLKEVITVADLLAARAAPTTVAVSGDTLALLQYTSGSTGHPKGVMLSHANLLANIKALAHAAEITGTDVLVSWLPLYHDMGLIGACLGTIYFGVPLILMSPLEFLARPARWLSTIGKYRGTLSAAPNFAYDLCVRNIRDADIEGLDLSSWRIAFSGAEAVMPATLQAFTKRFAPYGLRPSALTPVYGLAEAAVGITFPPLGRGPLIDTVDRLALTTRGIAKRVDSGASDALSFPSVGLPLPGYQVRIVDAAYRELPDRAEGQLQFKGPSATRGYYRNAEATGALIHEGWLNTGDRGYIAAGEIFITGRVKDIIIRAGRHIYPDEIESTVGEISGIRKNCVAAFGLADPASGTEQLVVMAETGAADEAQRAALREAVTKAVIQVAGEPPDGVVLVAPNVVLKTPSGKIRRSANRDLYVKTKGHVHPRGRLGQALRLGVSAAAALFSQSLRKAKANAYGAYFWALFGGVAALTWPLTLMQPTPARAWKAAHGMLRSFLRLAGVSFTIGGLENLPEGSPCILVANHSGYLDALFVLAALPRQYDFLVKKELQRNWLARLFLQKIGAQFIDRADQAASLEGTERVASLARSGHSWVIFPEGTFTRAPGLLPFHLGAFKVATEAQLPIVPVVIVGSRSMMRDGQWRPTRGAIRVSIGPPLRPVAGAPEFNVAVRLRNEARSYIAERCGEPALPA